jgi:ketosteroid isomerase-like protein
VAADETAAVRRIYAAFARWDVDEMLRDVTHDFELIVPPAVPFGGTRHGPEAIRTFARIFRDHVDGGFADPDDFLDAGDRMVVLGRMRGRGRSTGRDFEAHFAHVWTFSDGVPSRCRSYFDSAPILEALTPNGGG